MTVLDLGLAKPASADAQVDVAKTATFVAPLGPVVPIVAILVCVGIAAGATQQQLLGGAAALLAGAVMFAGQAARLKPRPTTSRGRAFRRAVRNVA